MPFLAGGILWGGYVVAWWGWMALTNRVPLGPPDHFHWPSIMDLVKPGKILAVEAAIGNKDILNQTLAGLVPTGNTISGPGATGDFGNITKGGGAVVSGLGGAPGSGGTPGGRGGNQP